MREVMKAVSRQADCFTSIFARPARNVHDLTGGSNVLSHISSQYSSMQGGMKPGFCRHGPGKVVHAAVPGAAALSAGMDPSSPPENCFVHCNLSECRSTTAI